MSGILSDDWLRALEASARAGGLEPPPGGLVIQQVVTTADGAEVTAYTIRLDGDGVHVRRGRAEDADVVFTCDRATAEAVHRGELSAQVAFMSGRLRVGGDLARLTGDARALAALAEAFAGTAG